MISKNMERARIIVSQWPQWKQDVCLTKYSIYKTCPRCRGYDLEKQWCLVCNKTGFILKPQSNN